MKRKTIAILILALCLTGCGDTVVFLPEEPMQMLAVPVSDAEAPTVMETETREPLPMVPEETEAARIQHSSKAPSSPNKGDGGTGSTVGSTTVTKPPAAEPKETKPKETKPAATEPEETKPKETKPAPTESVTLRPTQPAATKPEATEPNETEPPATESVVLRPTAPAETVPVNTKPMETEPPVTEPPVTEPPATEPPSTKPPATEPPSTKPPATEPPATEPSATEPPATEPPATEPPVTEPPLYDISGYVVGNLEYQILDLINEYRAEEGLEELYLDSYLCAIASCRAYEASLVWSHTRPDGRDFATVLDEYGYGAGSTQELLAYATGDAAAMVDKWMRSDSHRSILLGEYTTLGVGIYRANGYTFAACLLVE